MVACPECGFDSADAQFCDRCGRAFEAVVRPAAVEPAVLSVPDGFSRLSERFAFPVAYDWAESLLVIEAIAAVVEPIHREGHVHARLDPREIAEGPGREIRLLRSDCAVSTNSPANGRVVVPGYSAPEVSGRGPGCLTPATDVFSLGAIGWRLVTGRDPYADFDDLALAFPSPRLVAPVPFELDPFFSRAVALLARDRFKTLDELRAGIRRVRARVYAREHSASANALSVASGTDVGRAKGVAYSVNQDALVCDAVIEGALFAAIDGVTHAEVGTGELAAEITREALNSRRDIPLDARFDAANEAIVARVNGTMPNYDGEPSGIMGAAVVAAEWRAGVLSLAWLGDARAYLLRDGDLVQLTIDHDVSTDALRSGRSPREARELSAGGRLTRAVGSAERDSAGHLIAASVHAETLDVKLLLGDRVLLTTDGIPDWIAGDERASAGGIAKILGESSNANAAAGRLIDAANAGGGGDNLSCAVLFATAG